MTAVQLMTARGGWPLNCFALPDGKPIYGGTYFPPEQWKNVLINLADLYNNEPEKLIEYGENLVSGVQQSELIKVEKKIPDFTINDLHACYKNWSKQFDDIEGGSRRTPKFPLPNNYLFLLRYGFFTQDISLLNHVELTLKKMAYGGIYDQVGGGFARYSTDDKWKVPHFEKMLYDNAQLVSLYSEAFQATGENLYKEIVFKILAFIEREMTSAQGAFYSALDADSEGEEGKYYVWKKEQIKDLAGKDFPLVADYFNINEEGYWEHGNYILLRKKTDEEIAVAYGLSVSGVHEKIAEIKKKLLDEREKRIKPGLDDKTLTSWNALMIKGYIDAYNAFDEPKFLQAAKRNASFILNNQRRTDGGLFHNYKNGKSSINGFLEDYAFTIEAFIALYEASFEEAWLKEALALMEYTIIHFKDEETKLFFFTSNIDAPLIARKMELSDNVIPASNSAIAKSLFLLGHYYEKPAYIETAKQMLNNIKNQLMEYGSAYSNWAMLMMFFTNPFYEVAIVGKNAEQKRKELNKFYFPNKLIAGSETPSSLNLLKNRFVESKTMLYVCAEKICKLPVSEVKDAIAQLKGLK